MLNLKFANFVFTLLMITPCAWAADDKDCDERLTDKIRQEIDIGMWLTSQRPDAGTASQLMLGFMKTYPFVDFSEFERSLRRIDSTMYLLAIPERFGPPGHYAALPGPEKGSAAPKGHYLWVGIHGKEEALFNMSIHGITSYEENLKVLKEDTGVLIRRVQ